jgi:guanosine-3',5'-bis(diphosphate) 3'-pyrophosphohydrolase
LAVLFLTSHFTDDEDTLTAGVLHDTVEDTDTTLDEIEKFFGKNVRETVDFLSEDKSLEKNERKQKQMEKFKTANHNILLIKLADIIHNSCDIMTVLKNYPKEEYQKAFYGNPKEKIEYAEERLSVIETAWPENPLLPEAKSRLEEYKNLLKELKMI